MKRGVGNFVGLLMFTIIFFTSTVSADLNVSLSDSGSNVKYKTNGSLVNLGDLEVTIWDSPLGGELIYNETFLAAINNGSWNVMLGENESNPLSLEFGKIYYKDYKINRQDLNFTNSKGVISERNYFYSPLGDIKESKISQKANLTITNLNVSTNVSVAGTGFFSFLGDMVSKVTKLFIQNIYFNGVINGSGNITTTGRIGIGTESPSNSLDVMVTGNFSGLIYFNNATPIDAVNTTAQQALTINSTANIQQLLNSTGIYNQAGGNASWNQSFASTLYSGIIWNYNQTIPANSYTDLRINLINSTTNIQNLLGGTNVSQFSFNQTLQTFNTYNSIWSSTYNSTYANYLFGARNETSDVYNNWNTGWATTYNLTYANYAANVSRNWTLDVWNNWNSLWGAGSMNYVNLALTNQSNVFTGWQNFSVVNANSILLNGVNISSWILNISTNWTIGANTYTNSKINLINSTANIQNLIDNSSISRNGNCPSGYIVQNTTSLGVQCIADQSTSGAAGNPFNQVLNTTSGVTFGNVTASVFFGSLNWSWLQNVPNFISINSTANIQQLLNSTGIYNQAGGNASWNESYARTIFAVIGSGGNASWNQSFANTLYYSASNPNNYINSSANNSYYLSTNPSGYFNSSNYYSYNSTYEKYAYNVSYNWTAPANTYADSRITAVNSTGQSALSTAQQALTINSTANIQQLLNGTNIKLGNVDFNNGWTNGGASVIGGNLFAQTVYVYNISSLNVNNLATNGSLFPSFDNSFDLGNSSFRWKNIFASGDVRMNGTLYYGNAGIPITALNSTSLALSINTTNNIQNLLGGTNVSQFSFNQTLQTFNTYNSIWSSTYNSTYANYVTFNTTANIQQLLNSTGIYNQAGGNASWNQSFANTLYYSASNPNNYINSSANNSYYLSTNPSGYFNSSNYYSYNSTYANYVSNVSRNWTLDVWNNWNSLFSGNASWNESYARTIFTVIGSGGNASWNQSFANTLYSGIIWNYNQTIPANSYTDSQITIVNNSALHIGEQNRMTLSCSNITGAASNLCTITSSGNPDFTNVAWRNQSNIFTGWQNFSVVNANSILLNGINISSWILNISTNWTIGANSYTDSRITAVNSTGQSALSTAQQALTINSTANIQQLLNSTGIYNQAGGNASWNQSFANTLYYSASNPNNYINSSANNSYYLSTNPSGYFNSSNYYSYNLTYDNYKINVSRNWTLDVWNNWGTNFRTFSIDVYNNWNTGWATTYNLTYANYASNVSRNWTLDVWNNWNSLWGAGSMNYVNLALTNQSNIFTGWQNFSVVNANSILLNGVNISSWILNISTNWTIGANSYTDLQMGIINSSALHIGEINRMTLTYQNITNFPTCSGTDKLTFDGTTLSCATDNTGVGGAAGFNLWANNSYQIFLNETSPNFLNFSNDFFFNGTSGFFGILNKGNQTSLFEIGMSAGKNEVNLSGVLYINSTDDDVGINTINPQTSLDVNGNTTIRGNLSLGYERVAVTRTGAWAIGLCTAGKVVMGGGCKTNNTGTTALTVNMTLKVSEPLNSTAWNCTYGGAATQSITATAICTRLSG
ncbi:Uncharacterised protein [uncultured archaeon]|nr:Uncharacterised protein [uncultured archaeon]